MSSPNIAVFYQGVPDVSYRTYKHGSCAIWLDGQGVELDLVFSDRKDLGKLIRTLERVYKEGSKNDK